MYRRCYCLRDAGELNVLEHMQCRFKIKNVTSNILYTPYLLLLSLVFDDYITVIFVLYTMITKKIQ